MSDGKNIALENSLRYIMLLRGVSIAAHDFIDPPHKRGCISCLVMNHPDSPAAPPTSSANLQLPGMEYSLISSVPSLCNKEDQNKINHGPDTQPHSPSNGI
jgi:hypothetical protein